VVLCWGGGCFWGVFLLGASCPPTLASFAPSRQKDNKKRNFSSATLDSYSSSQVERKEKKPVKKLITIRAVGRKKQVEAMLTFRANHRLLSAGLPIPVLGRKKGGDPFGTNKKKREFLFTQASEVDLPKRHEESEIGKRKSSPGSTRKLMALMQGKKRGKFVHKS